MKGISAYEVRVHKLHVLHQGLSLASCSSGPRLFFGGSVALPLHTGYAALLRHTLSRQACPKTCSVCPTPVQQWCCASGTSYCFGRVDAGVHGEARGLPYGELPHCETARYKSTLFIMAIQSA
jgi:hypothetical protein